MSELIARRIGQLMSETGRCDTEVYLKSEADKVIVRNKYKRCLAMADRCRERFHHYVVLVCFSPNKGAIPFYERRRARAHKWMYKWREIADKLKAGV